MSRFVRYQHYTLPLFLESSFSVRKRLLFILLAFILIASAKPVLLHIAHLRNWQWTGTYHHHIPTRNRAVALTFDDGPGPASDSVLAILNRFGVKATFFLTGAEMSLEPERTARIIATGHEIGNHSWSHQALIFRSPAFIRSEVERTDSIIRALGYKGPIRFRPPFGTKLIYLPYYLNQTNRQTILWDIAPDLDLSLRFNPDSLVRFTTRNVRPGSIILLHTMYDSVSASLSALPLILNSLQAQGYKVTSVGDLLKTTAHDR